MKIPPPDRVDSRVRKKVCQLPGTVNGGYYYQEHEIRRNTCLFDKLRTWVLRSESLD